MSPRVLVSALLCTSTLLACINPERASAGSAEHVQAQTQAESPIPVAEFTGERVHDPAYAFELRAPDSAWELLGPERAGDLHPHARAAALDNQGATLVVIAEPALSEDFEQTAALLDQVLPASAERERITFHGFEALRTRYHQQVPGTYGQASVVHTVFLRDGYTFQVVSSAPGDPGTKRGLALQDSFVALELDTQGAVRGEPLAYEPIEYARGVTWRIHEGVHESIATGWRYRLPAAHEANYEIGEDLAAVGEFELFVSTPRKVMLSVQTERIGPQGAEGRLSRERDQMIAQAGPVQGTRTLEVAGERLVFEIQHHQGLLFMNALQADEGRFRKLTLVVPERLGARGERERDALLAGLEALSDGELADVRAQMLDEQRERQYCPGLERSAHGGSIYRFAAGVSWTAPSGFWDLCAEDGSEGGESFVFGASENELGLGAALRKTPQPVLEGARLEPVMADLIRKDREIVDQGKKELGELNFHWLMLAANEQQAFEYYAFAEVGDGEHLWLWVQAAPHDSPAVRAMMHESLTGLHFGAKLEPVSISNGRLVDLRLGVSVDVPMGAVLELDPEVPHYAAWVLGDSAWEIELSPLPSGADEDWGRHWVAHVLDDAGAVESLKVEPTILDGRVGEHLIHRLSDALSADLVTVHGHGFMLTYDGLSAEQIADARDSLQLP